MNHKGCTYKFVKVLRNYSHFFIERVRVNMNLMGCIIFKYPSEIELVNMIGFDRGNIDEKKDLYWVTNFTFNTLLISRCEKKF